MNVRRFRLLPLLLALAALPALAVTPRFARTPDVKGDTVVFSWEGDLFRVPLAGGVAARLTTHPGNEGYPRISPDGKQVAFRAAYDGPAEVYLAPLAGGLPKRLTFVGDAVPVEWTPDGKKVVFRSGFESTFRPVPKLYTVSVEGGLPERLLERRGVRAAFSPDGTKLAFHTSQGGTTLNVYVADLPAGAPRQLTFDREFAAFPCWSPDGRTIAFEAKREGDVHVFTVPAAGGTPLQLTHGPGQSWPYSFSPDGTKIAFAGLRDGVWNVGWVARDGDTEQMVTRNGRLTAYVRYPAWAPTGDTIFYELAETTGNIWLLERSASAGGRGRDGGRP